MTIVLVPSDPIKLGHPSGPDFRTVGVKKWTADTDFHPEAEVTSAFEKAVSCNTFQLSCSCFFKNTVKHAETFCNSVPPCIDVLMNTLSPLTAVCLCVCRRPVSSVGPLSAAVRADRPQLVSASSPAAGAAHPVPRAAGRLPSAARAGAAAQRPAVPRALPGPVPAGSCWWSHQRPGLTGSPRPALQHV